MQKHEFTAHKRRPEYCGFPLAYGARCGLPSTDEVHSTAAVDQEGDDPHPETVYIDHLRTCEGCKHKVAVTSLCSEGQRLWRLAYPPQPPARTLEQWARELATRITPMPQAFHNEIAQLLLAFAEEIKRQR